MLFEYLILVFAVLVTSNSVPNWTLEQVVILSRHNVRTPLSKNLHDTTQKKWPAWKEKSGYLTAKGVLLEGFMGEYFSLWLREMKILPEKCPLDYQFYVYANFAQRTMASSKAFIDKAFPLCNISIHHSDGIDPVFHPVIHNNSAIFQKESLAIMKEHISSLRLDQYYERLENILDYKNSNYCLNYHHCDLATDINQPVIKVGMIPAVKGPLKISKSVIDSFVMEYYEGFNINDVAWGELMNEKQWEDIMEISKAYHSIIFNTTLIAKDLARPMITYLSDKFLNATSAQKIILIMGHDANIYTVLNTLGIKPYNLNKQYEMIPVGGKIVFQKWLNGNGHYYLKIHYVYQGTEQMRNGVKLSLLNPPEFHLLQLEDCQIDKDGFCPWEKFKKLLINLYSDI